MKPLSYPKVNGGNVTDAIFNEQGHITSLWIALDPGETSIEFPEPFTVSVGCAIHLNTVAGAISK